MFLTPHLIKSYIVHDINNISAQVIKRKEEIKKIKSIIDSVLKEINYSTIISIDLKEEFKIIYDQICICYSKYLNTASYHDQFIQEYHNLLTILELIKIVVKNYKKIHDNLDLEAYNTMEDTMLDIAIFLNSLNIED